MKLFIKYIYKFVKKKLVIGYIPSSGRNFTGKICVHHQGGGNKRCLYLIDFYRRINCYGYILKKIKISTYSSYIGLIIYENGLISYILLSDNININYKLYSGDNIDEKNIFIGSAIPLSNIKLFMIISNIELYPYSGSKLIRSAGTSAIVTTKLFNNSTIKLKSGYSIKISNNSMCSIGSVSNPSHKYKNYKKAGILRSLGVRPTVRGVAMNPCDHPHGGGEGKKSPPVGAKTPWGKLTKGTPTVVNKKKEVKKKYIYNKKY